MAERSSRPPKSRGVSSKTFSGSSYKGRGEGGSYGKKSYGGGKPAEGRSFASRGEGASYGKKEYGDRPSTGGGYKGRSEGASYGKKSFGGDRPPQGRSYGQGGGSTYAKKEYGDKPYTERSYKVRGEGKPFEGRSYESRGEGPAYGKKEFGNKSYSRGGYKGRDDKPGYGGNKPSEGGYRSRDDGPSYGKKPFGGDKPPQSRSYGQGGGPSYGRKEYGDNTRGGNNPRGYTGRGEKPDYAKKSADERRTPEGRGYNNRGRTGPGNRDESPVRIITDMPGVREIDDWDTQPVQKAGGEEEGQSNMLFGRNVVRELLKSGRTIDRILIAKGETDGSLRQLEKLARDAKLVVTEVSRFKLDEMTMPFGHSGRPGNHQGILALLPAAEYAELDDIFTKATESGKPPFIIICDGITDPGNLGAVIRSAECFGAHGVIIPKRRSASLNAAAAKAASGAEEHVPVVRVPNLATTLGELKERGVWILGADMEGQPAASVNMKGPAAIVIGGEGEGLSALIKQKCDLLLKIPMEGQVGSLNASVAAAVLMYEKNRQELNS